ncbi:MAG: hypothetical protein J6S85_11005, partial [Methanobrevibacter sp.]|nr:hypothetical protein [Methanobrevibacter sp.]
RREPSNPYLPADGSIAQMAANSMAGYQPLTAMTPHGNGMNGYFSNDAVANQSQGFSVPNQQHGGMGQPELDGYGASLQAASDAAAQAQAREQQIADIQNQIATLEKRIAENTAKLQNFAGNADQIAAIEARKINSADPTSIWRWKVDRDEAKRIANAQNKSNDTARANALIDANNTLDSMIINDSLDTPTKNAMLSKLADVKSSLEKNGFDTSRVNSMISKLKGNGEQTTREQAKTDWKGLKDKPDLTSNEIQTALDNPDMNWDPDERKEAENLRDKLKKHEAATQDVKDMKAWVEKTYGTKWHTLSPRLQETYQRLWKNRKGKK